MICVASLDLKMIFFFCFFSGISAMLNFDCCDDKWMCVCVFWGTG